MWDDDALCRKLGILDFDDYGPGFIDAKRACVRCPIRDACLERGLAEPWGIWGGLNTVERLAHADGEPIRYCKGCGTMYARAHRDVCLACEKSHTSSYEENERAELIRGMAGAGQSDADIAMTLNEMLRIDLTQWQVKHIRRRHEIPPGRATGGQPLIRIQALVVAEETPTREAYLELTPDERTELMADHLRRGGTRSSFQRKYGLSTEAVRAVFNRLPKPRREAS